MERSVSRADLNDDEVLSSSPESIALDQLKAFDEIEYIQPLNLQQHEPNEADEELTAFRLFAPAQGGQQVDAVQNIRLKSPTPEIKEAGFVVSKRDASYYFTTDDDSSFQQVAVTAAEIHQLAGIKWTGMAYPWRVLNLPASQVTRAAKQRLQPQAWSDFVDSTVTKRRRPGKKARIKLRVKVAAAKTKAHETRAAQEAKDVAQREKKTRLNREKKAKKRQREKAKKAAAQESGDVRGSEKDENESDAPSD